MRQSAGPTACATPRRAHPAAGYDAERARSTGARRDACFDHPILQAHHGGPASNLAVAQHSPDPPRGRRPCCASSRTATRCLAIAGSRLR